MRPFALVNLTKKQIVWRDDEKTAIATLKGMLDAGDMAFPVSIAEAEKSLPRLKEHIAQGRGIG